MATFRILSFTAGGVKGALSARLLVRLTKKYPELISQTSLFSGSSTGSLIALGLGYNQSPELLDNIFDYEKAKYIFTPKHHNILRPKYHNEHLAKTLEEVFPKNLKIGSLPNYVFIPSFNVKGYHSNSYNTVFFNNLVNNPTMNEKVIDAALSSSAAPSYFPSHHHFIDGGVSITSPTISSVLYVRSQFNSSYQIPHFRLLSIGTGFFPERIEPPTKNWGALQWAYNPFCNLQNPLYAIMMDASNSLDLNFSQELLGPLFHNLNPRLDHAVAMDNYKEVTYLKKLADTYDLSDTYRYIERYYLK